MLETLNLSNEIIITLGILFLTAFLFIYSSIRVDAVAVIILSLMGITNLLTPEQLFSGFSSEAVISLISIMIISAGLENVGISQKVAKFMLTIGKEHPKKISFLLMSFSGILASFMRSLGTVSLFLPIVTRINARTGISKSYLLMPIAFCSILGGTLTMVGTGPLIVLNSLLKNAYKYINTGYIFIFEPFHLFEVLPIGIMLLAMGIIYWMIIGNKIAKNGVYDNISQSSIKAHFNKTYQKGVDFFELKVSGNSELINKSLRKLENKLDPSCSILAIQIDKEIHFPPLRKLIITPNSTIAIMGEKEKISEFAKENKLSIASKLNIFAELLHPSKSGLCEIVIPPSSQLIGKDVNELHMKRNYDVNVLAIYRGNTVYRGEELKTLSLKSGDTLGMFSKWDALLELQKHPDFVVLTSSFPKDKYYPKKMPHALFFFFLSIFLIIFNLVPTSVGLLLGAVGMMITNVLSIEKAYTRVSWKTVFLLAGLLPIGIMMQVSGTTDWLSDLFLKFGKLPMIIVQILLTIIATFLGLLVSNIGATVILVPIALQLAINTGIDPKIYTLTVALAASNTFLIPTHHVNALIAGPGNYSKKEFFIFGSGITILYWIVMIIGVNLLF